MKIQGPRFLPTTLALILTVSLFEVVGSAEDVVPSPAVTSSENPQSSSPQPATATEPQPAGGETLDDDVQNRGVSPRWLKKDIGVMPFPIPPPSISDAIPGEFAIRTVKNRYLTAIGGGGRVFDAFSTDAGIVNQVGGGRFYFKKVQPDFIQLITAGHKFVTANGGPQGFLRTNSLNPQDDYSLFRLVPLLSPYNNFAIKMYSGHFLTAVGGGGRTNDAIHVDATEVRDWEYYSIVKCGNLGSGYVYAIKPVQRPDGISTTWQLAATSSQNIQVYRSFNSQLIGMRLLLQADGTYAIQVPSGSYVTAEKGGGIANANFTKNPALRTRATAIRDWEKFRISADLNCKYTIRTVNGKYVAVARTDIEGDGPNISTGFSSPLEADNKGYETTFEFVMLRP